MNLAPLPIQKFFNNNGRPLDGGKLFTYISGTTTKIATYTDSSGGSLNTNPIILDFRGECRLWIDPTKSYTFVLAPSTDTDPPTNPFWTVNDITAAPFAFDNAAVDTGSVNAIALAIPQISSPVAFTRIVFKAANTNTGAVTISINGGTAKALDWQNIGALSGGEILANGLYEAVYDGAQWQLQGPTLLPTQTRSAAEITATITPSKYSYYADGGIEIDPRRYGLSTAASAATNATALNAALSVASAAGGAVVRIPGGTFSFNSTLAVPTGVQLRGSTMGFGSNVSTVLKYTGSGVAILVSGFYSRLADFTLKQGGTGTVGVSVTATQFMMERVTIMPDVSTGFSVAAYQSDPASLVFTHLLKRCYIYGCAIGVDFSWGNNFVIDGCFIESNGTNVRVGWTGAVTNFVCCNGTVIELFGDGRAAESLTGINIDLVSVTGFAIRDSYFEVDGAGVVGAAGQLGVNLRTVKGGSIEGNYFYGGGQATTIINAQATALDVSVIGNAFVSVAGYGIAEATGARVEVGINSAPAPTTGVINRTAAPVPVGLTVVNGTGGATYSMTWQRQGGRVWFSVRISVTGTCTTASTAGTTYFPFIAGMPAPLDIDVDYAVSDDATNNYGTALVATNSRAYAPTWGAVNKGIVLSGSYRCT